MYHICFKQSPVVSGQSSVEMQVMVDGVEQADKTITLVDDGVEHNVEIKLPSTVIDNS